MKIVSALDARDVTNYFHMEKIHNDESNLDVSPCRYAFRSMMTHMEFYRFERILYNIRHGSNVSFSMLLDILQFVRDDAIFVFTSQCGKKVINLTRDEVEKIRPNSNTVGFSKISLPSNINNMTNDMEAIECITDVFMLTDVLNYGEISYDSTQCTLTNCIVCDKMASN